MLKGLSNVSAYGALKNGKISGIKVTLTNRLKKVNYLFKLFI